MESVPVGNSLEEDAVATIAAPRWMSVLRNRPLMMLMLGHFTVDMYVGLLPVLYPLLIPRYQLNLQTVGLVSLAYSGVASLSQPLFGWLADRSGTRLIGLTMIWTGLMFALVGFAPTFPLILLAAAAAGLGSGAFHPLGALAAAAVIPPAQRNTAMSVYVTGGTIGVALGPLVGVLVFSLMGTHGTVLLLLPGLFTGLVLLFDMRHKPERTPAVSTTATPAFHPAIAYGPLIMIILVMMSRSWTMSSMQAFIPTWYQQLGYGAAFYGPLATTLILASAVGSIWCGALADRFGRRGIVIASLVLSIPPVILFARFPGLSGFATAALIGLSAASTGPIMLVMAQQLMAGRAGLASGLILGLGFVTGAIGVPVTGMIADQFGMVAAFESQTVLIIATIGLAWLLPTEARMRQLTRPAFSAEPEATAPVSGAQVRVAEELNS
jgi:FSR family fosmidomycin resistance protein-like MFS transporter